jgi:hypothetical protein
MSLEGLPPRSEQGNVVASLDEYLSAVGVHYNQRMSIQRLAVAAIVLALSVLSWAQDPSSVKQEVAPASGVLKAAETQKLVPQAFFYAGQTAPVQVRNSGAYRSPKGKLVLAALVDTSGYSSAVAEKYQGFLVTDGHVRVGGKELAPGAYGIGALPDGSFVVTDLGANTLLTVPYATDSELKRPVPLKFAPAGQTARLYLGKKYVTLEFSENAP